MRHRAAISGCAIAALNAALRAAAIALTEAHCRDSGQTTCDGNLAVVQQKRADDLRRLEALQDQAGAAAQVAAAAK